MTLCVPLTKRSSKPAIIHTTSQNLDQFTDIIRTIYDLRCSLILCFTADRITGQDLRTVTAVPHPSPSMWTFSPKNDLIFASDYLDGAALLPMTG